MMRADTSPPRWPAWLLERLMPSRVLESALGDLAEEYALRAQSGGSHAAACWYWTQIAGSMPALCGLALNSAGAFRTFAVAVGAFLGAGVAEDLTNRAIGMMTLSDPVRGIVGVIVGVTAIAGGAYVAARIRPAAALVMAALTFAVVAVLMITKGHLSPLAYQLAFLIGMPVASLIGGAFAARRPRHIR
jgi:hypothetical protein